MLTRTFRAYVGLGSNLEEPVRQIRSAVEALRTEPEIRLIACSSLYRSAPVGFTAQPDFVNAVAELETSLAPHALLAALLGIERRHGRVRSVRNGPRTLDLDLLLFDERTLSAPDLVVPHPRMHERAFVLVPLAEIAPDVLVPGRGRARDLARGCAAGEALRIGPQVC